MYAAVGEARNDASLGAVGGLGAQRLRSVCVLSRKG